MSIVPHDKHYRTNASASTSASHQHDSAASASGSATGSGSGGPQAGFQGDSDNASLNAPSTFSIGLSIDTDSSDADSALGSVRAQSSSMSASSSIFDFVEEHGRTWHRYHEGKYFMPNDIPEQERLDLQHSISVRLFGGLYLAPVDHPNRVLDIGTGTGIWAIEFANEHPESDVLGTDLSPIQPEYVPPNCRFEVDDAEDEWVFSAKFDLIHARFMCGSFSNFPAIFDSCYQNLNPGGWIEFQDYYVKIQSMDDSLAGTALERWNELVLEGVRRMGKNGLAAARFKGQMLDAGFVDVVERKFALPGNPWAKGDDQKMLGMMQMENILDGLHGMSIGLFTKMLGMSAEEVELFLVDVRRDMKNTKIHFYYIVYSVYGRRPPSN
ncbi:Demethylmenaquinone methyltransferase [Cytospora mali]|uniref:Demethylmenaquinone methyltransferase n=1 Tax=Cytospora mali TaxID=578113 RepID=A0A194VC47_CYTMA|nr:Demethylmenaquinone methyltransferase [Valsa mali var. pyri (nom. inval.)]